MDRSTLSSRTHKHAGSQSPGAPAPPASAIAQERSLESRPDSTHSRSSSSASNTYPSIAISEFPRSPTINAVGTGSAGGAGAGGGATSGASSASSVPWANTSAIDSDSDAISLYSVSSTSTTNNPPSGSNQALTSTTLAEIINDTRQVCIDQNASVEAAFELLTKHQLTCLPLAHQGQIYDSFDYADLTGYLLLVLGHITVKGEHAPDFQRLLIAARNGIPAPVGFAAQFGGARDPFVRMSADCSLAAAFERFARGVHRLAVTHPVTGDVMGLLSQRRLVRYVWEHPKAFSGLEAAFDQTLEELKVGTYGDVVSIGGDQPLLAALDKMHEHAVSSVAVVDSTYNLLGNISVVDVGLLTRAWQAGLLRETCKNFLSVILDHRSLLEGGNESVPVFYVNRSTKLVKVVATMVATRAHRLWICEPSSDPAHSGKLVGVVSLTDVLNFVMRQAGQNLDPESARRNRRSSSSSVRSTASRHSLLQGSRPRLSFNRERPPMP